MIASELSEALAALAKTTGDTRVVIDMVINTLIETVEVTSLSIVETVDKTGAVLRRDIRVNASLIL